MTFDRAKKILDSVKQYVMEVTPQSALCKDIDPRLDVAIVMGIQNALLAAIIRNLDADRVEWARVVARAANIYIDEQMQLLKETDPDMTEKIAAEVRANYEAAQREHS